MDRFSTYGGSADWETEVDYDPGGAEWLEHTAIGSNYQCQVDMARPSHYRHRKREFGSPWTKGLPPDEDLT
jgi:hypothetical protein